MLVSQWGYTVMYGNRFKKNTQIQNSNSSYNIKEWHGGCMNPKDKNKFT